MKLSKKFPYLRHFFGAYSHQGWPYIDGTAEKVIEHYVSGESKDEVDHAVRELDELLLLGLSDAELDAAVYDDFGCCYTPEPDGISMTEWLRWVRATLIKYEQLAPKGQ